MEHFTQYRMNVFLIYLMVQSSPDFEIWSVIAFSKAMITFEMNLCR